MIRASTFKGQSVAVFGLGSSGLTAAASLRAGGADVSVWDDGAPGRDAATAARLPIADLHAADWSRFSALVLAPGVPLTHPEPHWTVLAAKAAGVEVIGDVEIFCRERDAVAPDARFIAITGTNGKSTTTALISHILSANGWDVQMGGNIGRAVLTLDPPAPERVHVIEMSSFQIDLTPSLNPSVGVLLNVTPDHIDRHGTVENYANVKFRMFDRQRESATAVIGVDDLVCAAFADRMRKLRLSDRGPRVVPISAARKLDDGIFASYGELYDTRMPGGPRRVADLRGIATLRGAHNWQNGAASYAAASALGLGPSDIALAAKTFPGLPHRLETVAQIGPVDFINDSKATNADSTEKALLSFPSNIYWILGGKPKDGGITSLAPLFGRVAKAYLIGEAADDFAITFGASVPFEKCGTLDAAVARAADDALAANQANTVVLLSPACASYDQFKNFEVRGEAFRKAATAFVDARR